MSRTPIWIGPLVALELACNSPRLRNFLPAGAMFERTFGQLFEENGTKKASHYAVMAYSPAEVRSVATGTVEYVRTFDGMGNCLQLRPKKYFSTPNDFSRLVGLPKPGALVLALCNLDEPSVESAMRTLYTERLSAPEAEAAATHFLNHDEGFTRVDVDAHDTDFTQSTLLGSVALGRLFVAAFTERGDGSPRRYVNPMPYLAGALSPAVVLDSVPPELDEIVLETSATGDFGIRLTHVATGDTIPNPVPSHHLRVAVRATERTLPVAQLVVPYMLSYELSRLTLSGTTVLSRDVRARGTLLANGMFQADAAALGAEVYGAEAPITSVPETGPYFSFLGWAPAPPGDAEQPPLEMFDPAVPRSIDLSAAAGDGTPIFATGDYEIAVTARDAVNADAAAATRRVRFSLAPGGAPPGDGVLTYGPESGPIGTTVVIASAQPNAFASDTSVQLVTDFDPDGLDSDGNELIPSPSFLIEYPPSKVTLVDGQHLSIQVGAVLPSAAIREVGSMRYGRGGRLSGALAIETPSTGFSHTTAGVHFAVTSSVNFGQVIDGVFRKHEGLGVFHATSAAQVASAPDFQRLVAEWRVPAAAGTAPGSVAVKVRSLDVTGDFLDVQDHTLELVSVESGIAVYRSSAAGGRKLLFIDDAAFKGPQGADLVAVHVALGGDVRLDGDPPP